MHDLYYCYLFIISENEAIWLAEEPFRADRFFASARSAWNANAPVNATPALHVFVPKTEEWNNIKRKNLPKMFEKRSL
jgi:hypothetical protein